MSVQDLEAAVARLSKEELAQFSRWFEEYLADAWDRQIEADIRAGRFEAAGARARADYEAGRCTPL
jgi:outer membrane murein-binding lipoprotein Lpp